MYEPDRRTNNYILRKASEFWRNSKQAIVLLTAFVADFYRRLVSQLVGSAPAPSTAYRYLAQQIASELGYENSPRSIVFSSPESREVSNQIILMFAYYLQVELGCKVLILDGTFRYDGLTDRLDRRDCRGLMDYIYKNNDSDSLMEFVQPTHNDSIHFLPVGKNPGYGIEALLKTDVKNILGSFSDFHFIVIQQGSILEDTRYLEFARQADLVVLHAEEGNTLISEFEACERVFHDSCIENVRVVLSEAE